jgi:hypothetical protein
MEVRLRASSAFVASIISLTAPGRAFVLLILQASCFKWGRQHRSKDGKNEKTFDALEWLAAMCFHVPKKGEQMVRYYGYYRNVSRGSRKRQNQDEWTPCVVKQEGSFKECRKNRADEDTQ